MNNINLYKNMNKKDKDDWYKIVKDVVLSEEFNIRKNFMHHDNETLYEHLIKVSIRAYYLSKKFKCDINVSTIAGLLHDFYSEAWQYSDSLKNIDSKYSNSLRNKTKKTFFKKHGFIHGIDASNNVKNYYKNIDDIKIHDAIMKHMFPLSIFTSKKIPRYKESWIVSLSDKIESFSNFPKPKNWSKYLGMKRDNYV